MRKTILFIFCITQFAITKISAQDVTVNVFDAILFYDGYAPVVDYETPEGVIRQRNDLYSRKLSAEELASFGNTMTINVTIAAACDNYDRIGNVNLAFVPKGDASYVPADVDRIELGRFITPFMNKNLSPTEVPYTFSVDNVSAIFKDAELLELYDIWAELEVFGVPYAAQQEVAGCAGRIDVFYGTLEFVSSPGTPVTAQNYLLPINFKKNLNNYEVGATDVLGQTTRTISFDLPEAVNDASFYVITSSHGANAGGEEYVRRNHYLYLDEILQLTYKPGGVSCEPYRMYNTQGNGIYGPTPRTPAEWASFSNWCPGQVIPIRKVDVGTISAGIHTFKIRVPSAVFVDAQGYIPVSIYLQGTTETLSLAESGLKSYNLSLNPDDHLLTIRSSNDIKTVFVYNMLGQLVANGTSKSINLAEISQGTYIVKMEFANNEVATQKILKR